MTARLLVDARAARRRRAVLDDAAALPGAYETYLRTYRGIVRRAAGRRSSCCWTGCSRGRCSTRCATPRRAWPSSTPTWRGRGVGAARRTGSSAGPAPGWSIVDTAELLAPAARAAGGAAAHLLEAAPGDRDRAFFRALGAAADLGPRGGLRTWSWRLRVVHRTGFHYTGRCARPTTRPG